MFFLYARRRVECRDCGIVAELLPWAEGKQTLTNAYMQYLANWARKLSWLDVARTFRTSWQKVFHSVEWLVGEPLRSIETACFLRYGLLIATDRLLLMAQRWVADLWRTASIGGGRHLDRLGARNSSQSWVRW